MSVMKRLKTDGVEVAYLDQGKGPLVIIAQGVAAADRGAYARLARARARLYRLWAVGRLA